MSIASFREYLSAERNYSEHTIVAYAKDVKSLQTFLTPKPLKDASKKDVRSFLSKLVHDGLQERTVNRKISSLQAYYKFLMLIGEIDMLPTQGIKSLKFFKSVQIPVSENEINSLLDHITFEDTFIGQRDKLILQLLYYTGMRRTELINLMLDDIDQDRREIKVLGKRNKERIIPINKELMEHLKNYIRLRESFSIQDCSFLLITDKGKKIYPKLVYNTVNSYLSMVTDKRKKSPHILRHSFASHFLHNGADINSVKEILGHESLAATQNYTHNDIEQLKKVFNQTHPRESEK